MATLNIDDRTLGLLADQASAQNLSLDDYLRRLAQNGATSGSVAFDHRAATAPPDAHRAAWEQFVAAMGSWTQTHLPPGHFVDDSRESIYEGRGE